MIRFKLVGAALVLAAFVAAPASAQQAISEPGAFSFYHPNADVLNGGRPVGGGAFASPVTPDGAMADVGAAASQTSRPDQPLLSAGLLQAVRQTDWARSPPGRAQSF